MTLRRSEPGLPPSGFGKAGGSFGLIETLPFFSFTPAHPLSLRNLGSLTAPTLAPNALPASAAS